METNSRRNRGRPKKRWIEDIEKDIQIMGIREWRKLCKERAEWKKITEKAKTHSGFDVFLTVHLELTIRVYEY